jgi:hypothetical protein
MTTELGIAISSAFLKTFSLVKAIFPLHQHRKLNDVATSYVTYIV